jgi:thimet oligopeptidase
MYRQLITLMTVATITGCQTDSTDRTDRVVAPGNFAEYQAKAVGFHDRLTLPVFETTTNAILAAADQAIAEGNAALDVIGRVQPAAVTEANTTLALDEVLFRAGLASNRLGLLKETSPDAALREAATGAIKKIQNWYVGLDYREDVYAAIKAFSDSKPKLEGEDEKLLEETMRSFRRAGLALPKEQRDEVERLRKELENKSTDFRSNVTKAKASLKFTKAELDGVPEAFLSQDGIKTGDDEFTIQVNVTPQYLMVMDNAKSEAVRRRMIDTHYNLAKEINLPLMTEMVQLRKTIANKLGYKSWADYQIEPKMAKDRATALKFLEDLKVGLQPKLDAELKEYQVLKAKETGDPAAQVRLWDTRYFANQLRKEKFTIDTEALRDFFPYEAALEGMFKVYETIFGISLDEVTPPAESIWAPGVQLFVVRDHATGEPLGALYLDMFPRDGKYNHFAQFGVVDGKRLPDGTYQRPTAALICNFPPPQKDKPSLMSHDEVETLFHEFGHAMHTILTRANTVRFSGTAVPSDFVEAPSQMLENWVYDKSVLDSFAADYRDRSKKIPAEILSKLKAAKLATMGNFYRRQLSFAIMDLTIHGENVPSTPDELQTVCNRVLSEVHLPVPEGSAFIAYFGHMGGGYDAGYYGYAWADAISADMATVFENSPKGFWDPVAGRRLRDEIYAPGGSRDVNVSIEKFLGRPRSIEPFLKSIGIEK